MATQGIPQDQARTMMTDWYQQVLAEARKTDPAATISDASGIATLSTRGQQIPLTSVMQNDAQQFGITPAQMLAQKFAGGLMPLTSEQRQASQDSQLSALQNAANTAVSGGPQVQANIDQLKAFWQTPAGQGLDPNTGQPVGTKSAEVRPTSPDTGSMGATPFAGYSVAPAGGSTVQPYGIPRSTEPTRQTAPEPAARETAQAQPAQAAQTTQPTNGLNSYTAPVSAPYGAVANTPVQQPATPSQGFSPRYQGAQPSSTSQRYGTSTSQAQAYGAGNSTTQSSAQPQKRQFNYRPASAAPSRSSFGGS